MKHITLLSCFSALLLFSACKEVPTSEITFSVYEVSPATPTFGVEYTSDQGGGTTVTSSDNEHYSSGKIALKEGQYVSLKATCTAPNYELRLSIFVDGNLWKTGTMNAPDNNVIIGGDIPAGD